jgi:hypothetical protein
MKPHSQSRTLLVLRHAQHILVLNRLLPRFRAHLVSSHPAVKYPLSTNPVRSLTFAGANNTLTQPCTPFHSLQLP